MDLFDCVEILRPFKVNRDHQVLIALLSSMILFLKNNAQQCDNKFYSLKFTI